ncbi:hypothetical protein [Acetobacterium bakii]|uniref:Uncharacterized protein n=1 Tax=Acetobacterium bakii TaxID=52689 RepID=A0A0L6U446_9FIRM|nr:hypothetical protein [Acetobacterium bakii]KNZ42565.1 hypothetical protein AKG39_05260 [Acetobacterium bakii]
MSQIKRKRRLTAIEAAILGNILYLIIVILFKSAFDYIGRTGGFNYLFNSIELAAVGLFWIILFGQNFKNIYAGEKPRALKYIFFMLTPIVLLTIALTLVSLFWPGQDTNSIWNQFSFIAAPTIFWYLPYGLIYQLIGDYVSIFAFFGIALGITVLFQIAGMAIGRVLGRKYREETVEQVAVEEKFDSKAKKEKKKWRKKDKKKPQPSIGMERLSEESVHEGFRPVEQESVKMTEVHIDDEPSEEAFYVPKVTIEDAFGGGMLGPDTVKSEPLFIKEPPIENPVAEAITTEAVEASAANKKSEVGAELESRLLAEWKMTHPDEMEKIPEEPSKPEEKGDKSFFMETSKIKIIDEDDIEEYYRNKK